MNNNLSIYNETNQFLNAINMNEDGEITEEQYKDICLYIENQIIAKTSNIIAYINEETQLINAIKKQEERLKNYRKEKENKLEKIEKAVKESLEKLKIDKIETELGSMQLTKCPMSVEITDVDLIPGEFVKIKMEKQVDKTAIKNHFKETGEIIEGASIITTNTSLRCK